MLPANSVIFFTVASGAGYGLLTWLGLLRPLGLLPAEPGFGLVAAKGVSAYLIWEARRLGVPSGTLLRMVGNVALDAVISAVPLAGWVGDVFYRANLRNMALLREHLDRQGRPPR